MNITNASHLPANKVETVHCVPRERRDESKSRNFVSEHKESHQVLFHLKTNVESGWNATSAVQSPSKSLTKAAAASTCSASAERITDTCRCFLHFSSVFTCFDNLIATKCLKKKSTSVTSLRKDAAESTTSWQDCISDFVDKSKMWKPKRRTMDTQMSEHMDEIWSSATGSWKKQMRGKRTGGHSQVAASFPIQSPSLGRLYWNPPSPFLASTINSL